MVELVNLSIQSRNEETFISLQRSPVSPSSALELGRQTQVMLDRGLG